MNELADASIEQAAPNDHRWTPASPFGRARRWADAVLDRHTTSRWWAVKVAFASALVSLLLAAPSYQRISGSDQWDFILSRSRGDFLSQAGVDPSSHNINVTFRVAPRLVGWLLHFSSPWPYLVLQAAFGVVFLWAIARLIDEVLDDRSVAAILTVATACTYAGACGWLETRGNFDAIGLALVALAMLVRRWPLIGLLALVALFTDERCLFALPLVILFHILRDRRPGESIGVRGYFVAPTMVLIATPLVALGIREYFKQRYHLLQLTNVSPGNPLTQMNNYPNGLWGALEGQWIWVIAGLVAAWHLRERFNVVLTVLTMAVILGVGVSVFDITRSVMFVVFAVPLAAVWLRSIDGAWVKRCGWWCVTLSVVWPITYAGGPDTVTWSYPAPLQLVRAVFHLGSA